MWLSPQYIALYTIAAKFIYIVYSIQIMPKRQMHVCVSILIDRLIVVNGKTVTQWNQKAFDSVMIHFPCADGTTLGKSVSYQLKANTSILFIRLKEAADADPSSKDVETPEGATTFTAMNSIVDDSNMPDHTAESFDWPPAVLILSGIVYPGGVIAVIFL